MKRWLSFLAVCAGLVLLLTVVAWADHKVPEGEVPKIVMDAAKAAAPQAAFVSCEVNDRDADYHLDMKDAKGPLHLHVSADGHVTRLVTGHLSDHDVALDEIPEPVKAEIQRVRPGAEIIEVELGRHHGCRVYEIEIRNGKRQEELCITETGDLLKLEADHD